MTRVFFLSLICHNFDDQLGSNFHMFVILCICCEKTGLVQLQIVSRVFNNIMGKYTFGLWSCLMLLILYNIRLKNKDYSRTNLSKFLFISFFFFEIAVNDRYILRFFSITKIL